MVKPYVKIAIVSLSTLIILTLTGCKTIKVLGIKGTDIFDIDEGSKVVHSDGRETIIEKDGKFISDYLIQEVIKAKVE